MLLSDDKPEAKQSSASLDKKRINFKSRGNAKSIEYEIDAEALRQFKEKKQMVVQVSPLTHEQKKFTKSITRS